MENDKQAPTEPQAPEESHGLMNMMKMLLLVGVLVGAWYLLDWLINK